ncbi:MAG: ArsR family transcriptional regulator [Aigarchaeota archaeon]|nr:ArsR family transcriptional regulator [Candidatus Wolframiiraptor gerlachensis]
MSAQLERQVIRGRAYLRSLRNVRRGLLTRSRIIDVLLSRKASTIQQIAEEIGLSESAVRRHLKNMLAEGVVENLKFKGKILWRLSGSGQLDLEEALS